MNLTSEVKINIKGQNSCGQVNVGIWWKDLTKIEIFLIYIIASELFMFKTSNLAFEVKFDHVGQSSIGSKDAYSTKGLCKRKLSWYLSYFPSYGHLKFSIWPQRSNSTSEVKVHLDQKLRIWLKDFAEKKLSWYLP